MDVAAVIKSKIDTPFPPSASIDMEKGESTGKTVAFDGEDGKKNFPIFSN